MRTVLRCYKRREIERPWLSPSGPLDAVGMQGTASRRECQGAQAMAKPNKSRAQQTLQEHPLVTELLAEVQAIDDRRHDVAIHSRTHGDKSNRYP